MHTLLREGSFLQIEARGPLAPVRGILARACEVLSVIADYIGYDDLHKWRTIGIFASEERSDERQQTRVRSVSSYESQSMLGLTFASGVIAARKSAICMPESSN